MSSTGKAPDQKIEVVLCQEMEGQLGPWHGVGAAWAHMPGLYHRTTQISALAWHMVVDFVMLCGFIPDNFVPLGLLLILEMGQVTPCPPTLPGAKRLLAPPGPYCLPGSQSMHACPQQFALGQCG